MILSIFDRKQVQLLNMTKKVESRQAEVLQLKNDYRKLKETHARELLHLNADLDALRQPRTSTTEQSESSQTKQVYTNLIVPE